MGRILSVGICSLPVSYCTKWQKIGRKACKLFLFSLSYRFFFASLYFGSVRWNTEFQIRFRLTVFLFLFFP